MPPVTHTRTFRIRHYECDRYGHVNNANYIRYMQEAAMDASAASTGRKDRPANELPDTSTFARYASSSIRSA